jgi:DNA helicase II / ATP-dependent DNA helicase PcrA
MPFTPRYHQQEVLKYRSGYMGVSAVPGSGKTSTLSALAARLVAEDLAEDQEVLVVTLINSAVDNFSLRIREEIVSRGLVPGIGYRVRTLHGLAHDIVRQRPALVGLSEDFRIIDEREAERMRREAVHAWLAAHPQAWMAYIAPDTPQHKLDRILSEDWPKLAGAIAEAFIKRAKDSRYTPERILKSLQRAATDLPLARLGADIFDAYQKGLARSGAVDFDDLIRLALEALDADRDYLARLQALWPYVLEDEAQDSSQLQETILRMLAGPTGNWVRVGDPNQAIYDTFTNANPRFLRDFLCQPGVTSSPLPVSGRSTIGIMELANRLVHWAVHEHPRDWARGAFVEQDIQPTPVGDPQPNPPNDPSAIHLYGKELAAAEEVELIANSLGRWLPDHADRSVAVLCPRNERGVDMVTALFQRNIPHMELLRSTAPTRTAAGILGTALDGLAHPDSARKLAASFKAWRHLWVNSEEHKPKLAKVMKLLLACPRVEDYLWPRTAGDWLEALDLSAEPAAGELHLELVAFRDLVCRWQRAVTLPIDQLILTMAQDLFQQPGELALAHKMAVTLGQSQSVHPEWRLPQLVDELSTVARNERKFIGLSGDDTGFDPDAHKGVVVVTTYHKAKGLEWDRVYLMSVNNYDFPSGEPHDSYIAERWFVRNELNLPEEALAQLTDLMAPDHPYDEGDATIIARHDYVAERLRLFYVGITRAKRELIVTGNTGRSNKRAVPAVPFIALRTYWDQRNA